jgi:hypothetical protein
MSSKIPRRTRTTIWILGTAAVGLMASVHAERTALAGGIDPESNTDGYNPAVELYDLAEAQRLGKVARQRALNEFMLYSTQYGPGDLWGPPIGGPPIRQPIGYESKKIGPGRWMYRPLYSHSESSGGTIQVGPPVGEPLPRPDQAPAAGSVPSSKPRLPGPRGARPDDFIPPENRSAKPKARGPREF